MFAALSPYVAGLVIIIWLVGAYVIPRDFIRVQRANRAVQAPLSGPRQVVEVDAATPTPAAMTLVAIR